MFNLKKVFDTECFFQMDPLGEKIKREALPTARVIACRFQFPQWRPTAGFDAGPNSVWIYDHIR